MVHGKNHIPYWIDRRLTGLAVPEYDATISFGLPFESEDCPYGESRVNCYRGGRRRNCLKASAYSMECCSPVCFRCSLILGAAIRDMA